MRGFQILLLAPLLLLVGCWGSGEAKDKASQHAAFEEVIGFEAPAAAVDVKSSWYFMRDSYVRWLRFSCDAATIEKIRNLDGVRPVRNHVSHGAPGRADGNPNAPVWWVESPVPSAVDEFEIDRSKPTEAEFVHIWIDAKSRTVYATRDVFH